MLYLQQSLGIDFRDRILRIVHLGRTFKGIVLVDYFIKKYPPAASPGTGDETDPLALDLRNFVRGKGIKQGQIVIGLPKNKVILKEIFLPKVEEKQLKEMLAYEVERHIPFAGQDIVFDYQILSEDANVFKILLGIVRKDDLQKVLDLLDPEQVKPAVVDVASIAGMNWLISQNNLSENKITIVVDIGEKSVDLGILSGREIRLTRSFNRVENRLEDVYIIDETSRPSDIRTDPRRKWAASPQGEEEQPEGGFSNLPQSFPNGQVGLESLDPVMDECVLGHDIIRELDIAMNVLPNVQEEEEKKGKEEKEETEAKEEKEGKEEKEEKEEGLVGDLILTGSDAYNTSLSEYLNTHAGFHSRILNPLKNLTARDIPGKITSSLSVATGLALRGLEEQPLMLNFMSEGKKVRRKKNSLAATITFMVLAVILTLAWVLGLSYQNRLLSSELTRRLESLQPDVTVVKNMSQDIEKVDKQLSMIGKIVDTEISKMELLKELTTVLPADTWLDNLSASNDKLEINGYSESPSNLISLLEISSMFENVQFASSITKMGVGKERFKIKSDIEKGKRD